MTTSKVMQAVSPIFIMNFVAVYDCNCASDESLIVKACGITNPVPITSSSNSLQIVFKTDNSRNATGFKALWTTNTENINWIHSPNYPQLFPNDADEVSIYYQLSKLEFDIF